MYFSMVGMLFPWSHWNDPIIDSFSVNDILHLVPYIFYIPITLWWIKWTVGLSPKDIGWSWFLGRMSKLSFFKTFLFLIIGETIYHVITLNIYIASGYQVSFGSKTNILLFNLGYLFVPVLEEVLFRGVLCTTLSRWIGWGWAITVSAISFTVVHLYPNGQTLSNFILLLLTSFFYSWIFYKSRSIFVTTVFHTASNIYSLTFLVFPMAWKEIAPHLILF